MKQFTYDKTERLKSRKQIEQIFGEGKSFTVFPVKVLYLEVGGQDNRVKTGVGVSSRNFKKAVQRNRIRRLMREAYRTEKIPLHDHLEKNNKHAALFLLYIDKVMPEYVFLKEKMKLVVRRLVKELSETTS